MQVRSLPALPAAPNDHLTNRRRGGFPFCSRPSAHSLFCTTMPQLGTAKNTNGLSSKSNQSVAHRPHPQQRHTTTSTQPLPRVSDALPVQEKDSSVIDSRTAPDHRQRLLHSRFPSLNRIRSRKKVEDTFTSQRASSNSVSTDDAPSSPRSPQSPVLSFNSNTTATDPDGDKFGSLSIESQHSRSSSRHRQKPSSVYSTDSTEPLRAQEKAPRTSTASPAPTGNPDDWSEKPTSTPTRAVNMHQTSSRLLRMTDDDRPFTRVSNRTPFSDYNMHNQSFGGQTYFDGQAPQSTFTARFCLYHIQSIMPAERVPVSTFQRSSPSSFFRDFYCLHMAQKLPQPPPSDLRLSPAY